MVKKKDIIYLSIIVVLAIFSIYMVFQHYIPPSGHQDVMNRLEISYQDEYVGSLTYFGKGSGGWNIQFSEFSQGVPMEYSVWIYIFEGDLEVYATIWTQATSYYVEFFGVAGRIFTLEINGYLYSIDGQLFMRIYYDGTFQIL